MYLYQKFNYKYTHLKGDEDLGVMTNIWDSLETKPLICGFDTETDGLHPKTASPFLYSFGFDKYIFTFETNEKLINEIITISKKAQRLFAHNAKFDYHMTNNVIGDRVCELDSIIADSMTVARLTSYADDDEAKINLETLGSLYVDPSSKFAGKVIKKLITEINAERKKKVKALYYNKGFKNFNNDWKAFCKMVAFVDDDTPTNKFFKENYAPANYYDAYKKEPELVRSYAADDVVIMLEYLKKALPVLCRVDDNLTTFNRECELISVIARMERVGIKVDIDYALKSRNILLDYKKELYQELYEVMGQELSVGQHELIKKIFKIKFNYTLSTADKKQLKLVDSSNVEAKKASDLIISLRTIDKWLSTYIDGKLNAIVDGRIHTSINNSGAVSGRVSCDMQQQPKEPLLDRNGKELFHPRKMFIPDDGYIFVFED